MRIGIICYPTYGGSGVIATELGKALANRQHEVHFITYKLPVRLLEFNNNIFFHEVGIESYPLFEYPPYETVLSSRIVDVARREQLDLLHVHYAIPHASAAIQARKILESYDIHIPIITTLHGTDITLVGKDKSFEPVVTYSINESNGVTAVSQSLRNDTYNYFDIKKDIEVIPNFIDFNRFKPVNKNHFKKAVAPNNEKIIIHASNFRKVKRVKDVMQIFKNIHDELPCKLLMVGDGPERRECEEICSENGTCHDVRFLGKQDAVEDLLHISDLFLLPSENESFGLAALEAMACEVPVIATNVGGLGEIVQHGINGFTSNVGNVQSMSSHAITLLSDDDMLNKLKRNALIEAQKYDIDNIVPLYESYYKQVINEYQFNFIKSI